MSWRLYGARMETADFGGSPVIYQPFTLPRTTRVKAIRTWFIMVDPAFTEMSMQVWSDNNGSPNALLHTFDKTYTRAQLLTDEDYGAKEVYFDFTNARWYRRGVTYHLVPVFTAAAFDANSHVAWVHGYPDPNTDIDFVLTPAKISSAPFYLAFIGDDR